MSTPLSDPDNVMFYVVDNYVPPDDGFTDDEVQRILNGQPLVASAVESFHLPGKHDQDSHGDGGSAKITSTEDAMLSAYSAGYTVKKTFSGGLSGSSVELLELSDGSTVVRKTTPLKVVGTISHGNTTKQEYLAGRVFSAINKVTGNDDMVTARVDGNTILTTYAPGSTGAATAEDSTTADMTKQKKRAVMNAAQKRHAKLQGGKEIAMLDFLTRNTDRHGLNWIVDGDKVRPVDQGFAFIKVAHETTTKGRFENIPGPTFVEHWFKPRVKDDYSGYALTPRYTRAEVTRIRDEVSALRPAFEDEGALDWYDGLMARFALIEESVKK